MDEQRALLDSLMGFNRNRDRDDLEIKDFRDSRVCKFYLLGICPHDMFVNTKADCGACPKIHSDPLKYQFEHSDDQTIFDNEIERDFIGRINDIDRTIKRSRARVEEEKVEDLGNSSSSAELLALQADIDRLTAEAEKAGEEGDIDKAQELMFQVEVKNKEKEDIVLRFNEHRKILMARTGVDVNKKLRVCDICGSFLSILDSDKRLADHFMGKQHIGFQQMRDTVDAIKARREERRAAGGGGGNGSSGVGAGAGDGGDSSGRGRGSSRDRDRGGSRDRGRDQRDHRDGRRDGSRDRRDRDRDRDSRRDSSRDRRDDSRDRRDRDRDRDRRGDRRDGGRDSYRDNRRDRDRDYDNRRR